MLSVAVGVVALELARKSGWLCALAGIAFGGSAKPAVSVYSAQAWYVEKLRKAWLGFLRES